MYIVLIFIGVLMLLFLFCLCKISSNCDRWEGEYEISKNSRK